MSAPPLLNLDFPNNVVTSGAKTVGSGATALVCDRAAVVYAENAAGDIVSYAADRPVIDYKGLRLQPTSQQLLHNSLMTGGIVGTVGAGGALPSGFVTQGSPVVVVNSIADYRGLPCLDVTLTVNNTAGSEDTTCKMLLEPLTGVLLPDETIVSFSAWAALIDSSNINTSYTYMRVSSRDGVGDAIGKDARAHIPLDSFTRTAVTTKLPLNTVRAEPSVSFVIPAGQTGMARFRICAPQFETTASPTSFIGTHPDIVTMVEKSTTPTPGGAVVGVIGSGGVLPTGWTTVGFSALEVTAVDSTSVTIKMTGTTAGAATTANIRLAPISHANQAAAVGQFWAASAVMQVMSGDASAAPRLNIAETSNTGTSLSSSSTNLPLTGSNLVTASRTFSNGAVVYARSNLVITIPAASTVTCEVKISNNSLKKAVLTDVSTGLIARDPEVISLHPALLDEALQARTVVIEAYLSSPVGDETWLAMQFGGITLRLYGGESVGVVACTDDETLAEVNSVVTDFVFGKVRIALSWTAGTVSIAYPVHVGDYRKTETMIVPGLDPDALTAVYIGSADGELPCTTSITFVRFLPRYQFGRELSLQTVPTWAHPMVKSPRPLTLGAALAEAAAFELTPSTDPLAVLPGGCTVAYVYGDEFEPPELGDDPDDPDHKIAIYPLDPDAPYVIPVDVLFPSKYGPRNNPDNPDRSIPNECWQAIYLQHVNVFRKFQTAIVKAAENWLAGDQDAAHAGLRLLTEWAEAGAFLGRKNETGFFQCGTYLCAVSQAYGMLRNAGGTPAQHATILAWIEAIARQLIPHMDKRYGPMTVQKLNNHYYWESAGLFGVGRLLSNAQFIDRGLQAMRDAIDGANPSGAWPAEMERGDHGLSYQCYCSGPVQLLVENTLALGAFDPYSYRGGHLKTIIAFTLAAVDDPQLVTAEQQWMVENLPGYEDTTVIEQIPIPIIPPIGSETGEAEPRESNVAMFIQPYRRLTTAEAPWREEWGPRFEAYGNNYITALGGPLAFIYVDPAAQVPPDPIYFIDFHLWKITLPIDENGLEGQPGTGRPIQFTPPTLYSGPYFYRTLLGSYVFAAPAGGAHTPGSSYGRSELRGLKNPLDDQDNFSVDDNSRLECTCAVLAAPVSGKVTIGQIHDLSGNPLTRITYTSGAILFQIHDNPLSGPDVSRTAIEFMPLGQVFDYVIDMTDNVLTIQVDDFIYTETMNAAWAGRSLYFKAGAYVLDATYGNGEGRVEFFKIDVTYA